jgi:hypothetical protein
MPGTYPAGSWTVDAGYCDAITQDQLETIFKSVLKAMILKKINAKDILADPDGILTPTEKAIRSSLLGYSTGPIMLAPQPQVIELTIGIIKNNIKWTSRPWTMPSADITSVIDTYWAQICDACTV